MNNFKKNIFRTVTEVPTMVKLNIYPIYNVSANWSISYSDVNGITQTIGGYAGAQVPIDPVCAQDGSVTNNISCGFIYDGPCDSAAPVDCVVSAWSDWSTCTNGSQTRTRTVTTPASNGGTACPVLNETQSCSAGGGPTGGSMIGFSSDDSLHEPYVTYIDGYGTQQTILVYTETNDCITFYARSVVESMWCSQCL